MNGFDWKRPKVGMDAPDGYKSPVTLYYQDQIMNVIQEETDNRIMGEIRMYVDVDKEELIKALNYDRQQYRKGWDDAVNKYVRFGKWIPDNLVGGGYWVCTSCKHPTEAFAADRIYKYCPFCGARMEE